MRKSLLLSMALVLSVLFSFSQSGQKWSSGGNTITSSEYFGTNNDQPIRFFTDGSEKMRLMRDGKLGIGVLDPQTNLHLEKGLRINDFSHLGFGFVYFDEDGNFKPFSFPGDPSLVLLGNGTFGKRRHNYRSGGYGSFRRRAKETSVRG